MKKRKHAGRDLLTKLRKPTQPKLFTKLSRTFRLSKSTLAQLDGYAKRKQLESRTSAIEALAAAVS